jgi:hypothetical protein
MPVLDLFKASFEVMRDKEQEVAVVSLVIVPESALAT